VRGSGFELNPDLIQNTDGERHSRLRTIFSRHYGAEHRLHWAELIEQEAQETLETLAANSVFDVRRDFFEPVARRSAERLFGFPDDKRPGMLNASFDERAMLDLQDHVHFILQNERNVPAGSYLQGIIGARKRGLVNQAELIANLTFFISLTFEAIAAPF